MVYPKEVKRAMDILEGNGYEAYLVGGCLRNILMGKAPHDWDMTTSALPHECAKIFTSEGFVVIETGIKHGTVTVIIDSLPIETTTFRIDGDYSDSRHPESVTFTPSLREDLARRDFTVNAMAYNEKNGLVDIFCGKDDLENMILRAVGEPQKRFSEDALRILRAFRFASEHGFKIEDKTKEAIMEKRSGLANISRERIYYELCRTLLGDFSSCALRSLLECGIMPYIFEEYEASFEPDIEIFERLPKKVEPRLAALLAFFPCEIAHRGLASLKMSNRERIGTKKLLDAADEIRKVPFSDAVSARKFISRFENAAHDGAFLAYLLGYDAGEAKKAVEEAEKTVFPRRIDQLEIGGRDITALGASGKMTGDILNFLLLAALEDPSKNDRSELISLAEKYILENKNEHSKN